MIALALLVAARNRNKRASKLEAVGALGRIIQPGLLGIDYPVGAVENRHQVGFARLGQKPLQVQRDALDRCGCSRSR